MRADSERLPSIRLVFDRGTVLVVAPHCAELQDAPGLLWDPRVRQYRAPGYRHDHVLRILRERGFTVVDEARSSFEAASLGCWQPPPLRPYQSAALVAWELAGKHGLVVLPTGAGKTRVALAAMSQVAASAICLVPTRVLLHQWLEQLRAVYAGEVGCLGDGTQDIRPITVATFESAYRWMSRLGNRFELIVVDEAHHFGTGMRDEALEMSLAPARLGLTATPPSDGPARARLDGLIGPVVYQLTVGDLAGRFLAGFDVVTLRLELNADERASYDAWMAQFRAVHAQFHRMAPDAEWTDFVRSAARSAEGRRALDALRRARKLAGFTESKRKAVRALLDRHRQSRVLVFTADNDAAYSVAREHLVAPLTCDISAPERNEVLERFRRGELSTLVSARVLNEGLDVPDADVAIVVAGAHGEREHVQRVGRLLRPAPGKRAVIYELVSERTVEINQARRRRDSLAASRSASL